MRSLQYATHLLATMLSINRMIFRSAQAWSGVPLPLRRRYCPANQLSFNKASFYSSRSSTDGDGTQIDDYGRRVRKGSKGNPASRRGRSNDNWDEDDRSFPSERVASTSNWDVGDDGWDDFDPFASHNRKETEKDPRRRQRRDRSGGPIMEKKSYDGRRRGSLRNPGSSSERRQPRDSPKTPKINMNALEGAGWCHLYGISSILSALEANRREFSAPEYEPLLNHEEDDSDGTDLKGDDIPERKPEAQFSPWLFVQEREIRGGRSNVKAAAADKLLSLAKDIGLPIAHVDKGVLNSLCGNRPHQGFVLRCGKLDFEPLPRIPHPSDDPTAPNLWLVLDEVVDPQNLGALLRSAFFLGGEKVKILLCSKNSAPPSPVVSAASAGALELMTVYSTSNLPRTLASARSDGFRIVGASSSVPGLSVGDDDNFESSVTPPALYELQDLPPARPTDMPVLLVLGSEGHGLRSLVAKACTEFVRIPAGNEGEDSQVEAGVDSLNVSVTGGILLWHMLRGC